MQLNSNNMMRVSKPKVLLLENIHENAVQEFKEVGFSVETVSGALGESELTEKIKDVSILGIRSKTLITKKILDAANKLMVIGTFCVGTNQVDLQACALKGVCVFNAPYSNTRSVVELTIGEIFMLIRNVFDKSMDLHNGIWNKSAKNSFEVRGKKLGIIGYGNIGSQMSVLAESMGMNVYYYDIKDRLSLGNATKCKSMKDILNQVDIVTVHVDGNKNNVNLIGEKEFGMMKEGVVFLNISRGFVVDIKALVKNLKNGKIIGAGIDVFPKEPKNNAEVFMSELRGMKNVILTPHIGGNTKEAQENIAGFVSKKITDFVNSGDTTLSVNFPNLSLPEFHGSHRIIHIHENIAGVLSQINYVFAKNKINIEGQYLQTNNDIGYVITDVNAKIDENIINKLKEVSGTIRFRVLN